MSLLEAPCTKTSWQALLFRAILGITGALIACFVIWWFKLVNNRETGFGGHHCDLEQHVSCLTVHVCMNSVKLVLEAPSTSILWGRYYSVTMCRLIWGALLLGRALLIGTLRYVVTRVLICQHMGALRWNGLARTLISIWYEITFICGDKYSAAALYWPYLPVCKYSNLYLCTCISNTVVLEVTPFYTYGFHLTGLCNYKL